jgi:hypothetical protein
MVSVGRTGKDILLQVAGWILVLAGLAALILPGPGALSLLAGMAILATQYEWADRRLAPVKRMAVRGAEGSVKSVPRISMSALGSALVIGVGIYWGLDPAAPPWWPFGEKWWCAGGWGTGSSLIVSGVIAGALLAYSYRRFRTHRPANG